MVFAIYTACVFFYSQEKKDLKLSLDELKEIRVFYEQEQRK